MTTCPSGVHYMHLVDHARAYIEETYQRPWHDRRHARACSRQVLPYPGRFRLACCAASLGKPFAGLLGGSAAGRQPAPAPCSRSRRPASRRARPSPGRGVFAGARPATRTGRDPVGLRPAGAEPELSTRPRSGCSTAMASRSCCRRARAAAARSSTTWAASARRTPSRGATSTPGWPRSRARGSTPSSITASGCGTTVKDYGFMFRNDPAYAEKARAGVGARQGHHRVSGERRADRRRCAKPTSSSPITPPARCSTASRSARSRRSSCGRPASA